jgi:hypothetical protein
MTNLFNIKNDATPRQLEVITLLAERLKDHRNNPEIVKPGVLPRSKIDADSITDEDLESVGFKKSLIAVPEIGQSQLVTYRHPFNGLHFHRHPTNWLFHEDKYPALSMVMEKFNQTNPDASIWDKIKFFTTKALPDSADHIIDEGTPGWTNWIASTLRGSGGLQSENKSWDLLKLLVNTSLTAGGLTALSYLVGNKDNLGKTFISNVGGIGSFILGNSLAKYLHEKISEKNPKFKRPNKAATALLVGLPALSAYLGYKTLDKLQKDF